MIADIQYAIQSLPEGLDLWNYIWDEENTISPSSLNMFLNCPRQWRYKSLGLPTIEVDMTYANFGNSVHGSIAEYYNSLRAGGNWLADGQMRERIESFILKIKNRPKGKDLKRIVEELFKFEQWRKKRYPNEPQKPNVVELYFKTPPFHGYIDFAAHDFVLDWKTGKSRTSQEYIRQVNAYFYASTKLELNPKKGFLMFIENGMKPMIPINQEKVLKEAYIFFQLTSTPDYNYPANKTYKCRWCGWRNLCEMENYTTHDFILSRIIDKRIQRLREVGLF